MIECVLSSSPMDKVKGHCLLRTGLILREKIQILKWPNSKAIIPTVTCNTFKKGFQDMSGRKEGEAMLGEFLLICSTGAQWGDVKQFKMFSIFEEQRRK